ncbi:MAG: IS3 family transposase, partial [Propionibacteriaceae bacterium]
MARLLEVSRSGYYDWARRQAAGPSPAEQRRIELTGKIVDFHAASDHVYGSPRIRADLAEAGERVSAKTVAKLMRHAGIVGISPRGFTPVTTQAGPDPQPVPDLVGRRFDRGQLNVVWTSDITYLATGEGWLYLCAIRDGCSRRVLGWAVEDHMRTDLVEAALRRAVTLRGELPEKVIFHADRGTQYTSEQIANACAGAFTWQGTAYRVVERTVGNLGVLIPLGKRKITRLAESPIDGQPITSCRVASASRCRTGGDRRT